MSPSLGAALSRDAPGRRARSKPPGHYSRPSNRAIGAGTQAVPAAGVEVNARFPAGSQQMLLHASAWNGDLSIAKLLVAKGADRRALEPASSCTQTCRT
jgi:hypothetical protein